MKSRQQVGCSTLPLLLLLWLLTASFVAAVSDTESLIGWQDFHVAIADENAAKAVRHFAQETDCVIASESHLLMPEDILVRPEVVADFRSLLKSHGVEFKVAHTDIGSLLLKEKMENAKASRESRSDPTTSFVPSNDIYAWMKDLEKQYPSVLKLENYGSSYEKRELLVLKLSTDWNAKKPIIFLDAAIHAREWLAPAALCHIIKAFLADTSDPAVQKYDWYFVPVINPDGYDFTFRSPLTRFWRKTRQPYGSHYGADPNRNFAIEFAGPGTSNNPASDMYHGPCAFSEPETLALSKLLTGIRDQLADGMYVSFHTYGQMWLTPPGYTRFPPKDHEEMVRVAKAGDKALNEVNGRNFAIGQPANIGLYELGGGSYDWVKYALNVNYSYSLELFPEGDSGLAGFVVDASEIPKSGAEVFAALKASAGALP